MTSFQNALRVLSALPETDERLAKELEINCLLCGAMTASPSAMTLDRKPIMRRAEELAQRLKVSVPLTILVNRLINLSNTSHYSEALRLAEELRERVPSGALEESIATLSI